MGWATGHQADLSALSKPRSPSLTSCQNLFIQTSAKRPRLRSEHWPWRSACACNHTPSIINMQILAVTFVVFVQLSVHHWVKEAVRCTKNCFLSLHMRGKHLCLSRVPFIQGPAEEQVTWVNLSTLNKMKLLSAGTRSSERRNTFPLSRQQRWGVALSVGHTAYIIRFQTFTSEAALK